MKLSRVAQRYNRSKFYDAYTDAELGTCQLDVYDDSKRDGATVQRRVIELAPDLSAPQRKAIKLHDTYWVVGAYMFDAYNDSIIRKKYVVNVSAGLSEVYTIENLLSDDSEEFSAHCGVSWVRDAAELEISSDLWGRNFLFYSDAEPLEERQIVELGGKAYIILALHPTASGFMAAVCEELQKNYLQTVTIETNKVWDPINESWTSGTTATTALLLRWQSDFEYHSKDTPTFERGDMNIALSQEVVNGQDISINSQNWKVQNVNKEDTIYFVHVRRS